MKRLLILTLAAILTVIAMIVIGEWGAVLFFPTCWVVSWIVVNIFDTSGHGGWGSYPHTPTYYKNEWSNDGDPRT